MDGSADVGVPLPPSLVTLPFPPRQVDDRQHLLSPFPSVHAQTEVLMLERLSHPNLVSLRGYCAHGEMAFLVYEYVSKGALNYHLFSSEWLPPPLPPSPSPTASPVGRPKTLRVVAVIITLFLFHLPTRFPVIASAADIVIPLSWHQRVQMAVGAATGLLSSLGLLILHPWLVPHPPSADNVIPLSWQQRVQIAVGAATGLHHLHERNIIHRDFKSSNILLDDNLVAKVSDFGLAKVGPVGDESYVETKVKGTPGYIDPAYMERGRLTVKSDVYAFGVVLLELLTGRHATDSDSGSLAQWVWEESKVYNPSIVDARIKDGYSDKGGRKFFALARACINVNTEPRPEMSDVLSTLNLISKM
ncbi:unnamed protein product [Closterium sp. NIES-54]